MIDEGKRVSLEYTLKLEDGTEVATNIDGDPLIYEHGGGELLPKLEVELVGLAANDTKVVVLAAADGYGDIDPEAFRTVQPDAIPEDAREVGAVLVAQDDEGNDHPIRVHEVHADRIVLDFNHPLAGQVLHFDVRVLSVDEAPAQPE